MSAVARRGLAVLSLGMIFLGSALAQDQAQELRAVTGVLPPFVMKQGDQLTGFSVDLWNEIAARLKLKTNYQVAFDMATLVEAARTKNFDVAVSAVVYTTERDREFDFSLPIMEAGLQVMVRGTGEGGTPTPLKDVLALLFSQSAAIWLVGALLIVLIPAHVIWLLDRGNEGGASPSKKYFPGIFQALNWATTALVSQVQTQPRQWLARVLGILWMFVGVVFIALYTAQLTATLTVDQIKGAINGPGDLPGKRVAALADSTAAAYLRNIKAEVREYQTTDEMFAALLDQKADAVLATSPVLRYYAAHDGTGRVTMVGPEFNKQDIGFVFELGSPLRRTVNSALIALREDGTYERIYDKWFGSE